jgi:hypothetical protein
VLQVNSYIPERWDGCVTLWDGEDSQCGAERSGNRDSGGGGGGGGREEKGGRVGQSGATVGSARLSGAVVLVTWWGRARLRAVASRQREQRDTRGRLCGLGGIGFLWLIDL